MLNLLGLLLMFQVPGTETKIPGIPPDFFTPDAGKLVLQLYDKIFADAQIMAVYLLVVTFGIYLIDKVYKNQISFSMIVVNVIGTAILLVAISPVFKYTLEMGSGIATDILTPQEITELNKQFSDAAKAQDQAKENQLIDLNLSGLGDFLKTLSSFAGLALGASIWGGVYTLIAIFYFLSVQVVMLLWKTFALILFLFAPICVAFGVIPNFGTRIVASWYGSVVQLSAWQIWIALCCWFVKEADTLFFKSLLGKDLTGFDPREQFNAITLALLFIILNFAGPVIISLLIPTSRFVAGATGAIAFVANSAAQTVKSGAQTVAKVAAAG